VVLALAGALAHASAEAAGPIEPLELEPASADSAADTGAPRVALFGFASTSVFVPTIGSDNQWAQYFPAHSSFTIANLNLYVAAQLTPRLRSMIETRFLVVPQGVDSIASDGRVVYDSTEVQDPAEFGRVLDWGGILVERAYLEYDVARNLSVRAGRLLTPYGIWNVDHGAPVIVGIRRPWTIRSQLFPERQTGLELFGARVLGAWTVGYHLTLSNGRGPTEAYGDLDANKAVGGRVEVEWRGAGQLNAGASFYAGRYTRPADRWVPSGQPHVSRREGGIAERYDERAVAADVRYTRAGLLLQSEFVLNDRRYTDPGRPVAGETQSFLVPDFRRWGAYGLVGWRFARTELMPYFNAELYEFGPGASLTTIGAVRRSLGYFVGVNYRPRPDVVLKVELFETTYPGAPSNSWGADHYSGLEAEAAWAF
jgi:hypothetical protein